MVPPDETAQPANQPGVILERGQTLDRFVILGLLGRGGMGEVYAAYDPELDRKIAIKVLRARGAAGAGGADARSRLLREAQAIAKLSHPNVVVVFDVGTLGEGIFLAMEFVDGNTLGFWLHAVPRSWRETLAMFLHAGRGLAAAHDAGIVHRDFKPDNVMVSKDGNVRVMDFGLARQIDENPKAAALPLSPEALEARRQLIGDTFDPSTDPESTARLGSEDPAVRPTPSGRYLLLKLTQTGALLGTPAYMAPEQFAALAGDARTDQFSFCVGLYEGLYGQRPFTGDTLVNLMANVSTGAVRDPPPRTRVPGWIRKVLLRGLAPDPAARYPSMKALLAALETDPTVRGRRAAAGVAGLLCLGALALGARHVGGAHEAPCQGGAQLLAGIWEAGNAPSARKDAIHRAFAATGRSYAEQAFTGAGRFLTAYADRWSGMHRDTCVATHVRGEQSAEVLDLRMSCLHERLTSLRALTDVFAAADGTAVENAVSAAGALPSLDRCADVALLKAVVKPPENEATRARVEALRRDLADLRAQGEAGHCADANRMADALLPEVRKTAYLPLLAETLNATGHLADSGCGDESVGLERLREAYSVGLASRHDEAAAEAAARVAGLSVGNLVFDPTAAQEWISISRAMNARIGGRPRFESWLSNAESGILRRQGRRADALAAAEKFRNLTIQTVGKDHPDIFNAFNATGLCFEAAGRYEEARGEFVSARVVVEKELGPDHPKVAFAINNEAEVLNLLHRHAEARARFQRALEIWQHSGSDPFFTTYELTGLGIAYLGEGRPADAVTPLEEALRIRTNRHAGPEQMGEVRFALARALWQRPAERGRARALAAQALADYAQVKQPDIPAPDVAAWLRAPSARL